jgi:hypothetical protein
MNAGIWYLLCFWTIKKFELSFVLDAEGILRTKKETM